MVIEDDDLKLVEGGLLEYNPTGLAADTAMKLYTWQPQVVLSLGWYNLYSSMYTVSGDIIRLTKNQNFPAWCS